MSRFLTRNKYDELEQEIESMDICKWRINDVCCNDKCEYIGDYPNPREMCYSTKLKSKCKNNDFMWKCRYYEKEDGKIY